MPEGPEIRRAADRVAAVLVGKTIETVAFGLPRLRSFERRLQGQEVTAVETRGKAMLTRFDNGLTIYSHNQLYGRWYTMPRPRMPKTERQLRIELRTATHRAARLTSTCWTRCNCARIRFSVASVPIFSIQN